MRFVFQYGGGIFCYFVIQPFGCVPVAHNGGIMLAQSYALSASHAFGIIYFRFAFCVQMYGIVSAMFYADVTPYAISGVYFRLGRCMQFQFAAYAGTSHSEIFQSAAKSGLFMPFKVVHADYDVRIGDSGADLGSRAIFSVYRYFPVIRTFDSVCNNHLALGGYGIEPVLHCALQMVHSIGTAAGI